MKILTLLTLVLISISECIVWISSKSFVKKRYNPNIVRNPNIFAYTMQTQRMLSSMIQMQTFNKEYKYVENSEVVYLAITKLISTQTNRKFSEILYQLTT